MKHWYAITPITFLLLPLTILFYALVLLRRALYSLKLVKITSAPVPVWVVGNIFVGGVGKTPITMLIVEKLKEVNISVAVVSRGYGGSYSGKATSIRDDAEASLYGDEPLLIKRKTGVPVYVAHKRVEAVNLAVKQGAQLIISDDGLQHYAMARSKELVVIDAKRGHGNGLLLPAGPLREPKSRLKGTTVIYRGFGCQDAEAPAFKPVLEYCYSLQNPEQKIELNKFREKSVVAMAGIGNPDGFFKDLNDQGIYVEGVALADHQTIDSGMFDKYSNKPILITEKDAVKLDPCQLNMVDIWVVPLSLRLNSALSQLLDQLQQEASCLTK